MRDKATVFQKLREPFSLGDLEWRVQRAGRNDKGEWALVLTYITNRAIMERLDSVVGPENWQNMFKEGPNGGVICGLGLRWIHPTGKENEGISEWLWKWDGADNTDIESVKGGLSDAMKRAAVQWGIGRYLYNLEAAFAKVSANGKYRAKIKGTDEWFKWDPPDLPAWALPAEDAPKDKGSILEGKNALIKLLEDNRSLLIDPYIDDMYMDMERVKTEADIETLYRKAEREVKARRNDERKEGDLF